MAAFKFCKELRYHRIAKSRSWLHPTLNLTPCVAPVSVPVAAWRSGVYFALVYEDKPVYKAFVYDSVGNSWYASRRQYVKADFMLFNDPGVKLYNTLLTVYELNYKMLSSSAVSLVNHYLLKKAVRKTYIESKKMLIRILKKK